MEILIHVLDSHDAIDAIKKGEVCCDRPDGWAWSELEKTEPFWRIIRTPLLQAHCNMLLKQHTMSDIRVKNTIYPRMAYLIDVDKLPHPELFKGARTQPYIDVPLADVLNAVVKVPV